MSLSCPGEADRVLWAGDVEGPLPGCQDYSQSGGPVQRLHYAARLWGVQHALRDPGTHTHLYMDMYVFGLCGVNIWNVTSTWKSVSVPSATFFVTLLSVIRKCNLGIWEKNIEHFTHHTKQNSKTWPYNLQPAPATVAWDRDVHLWGSDTLP